MPVHLSFEKFASCADYWCPRFFFYGSIGKKATIHKLQPTVVENSNVAGQLFEVGERVHIFFTELIRLSPVMTFALNQKSAKSWYLLHICIEEIKIAAAISHRYSLNFAVWMD